jgi:exosome complex RNA-binding protein Csl4
MDMPPLTQTLPTPITEYVEASNTFDGDRLIAAFAPDAMVNDAKREFWGVPAIKRWADTEIIGDKVTMEVTEVKEHHGSVIVNAVMDGEFDKTNLPDPIVLTHYFTVADDAIVTLVIILNTPGPH